MKIARTKMNLQRTCFESGTSQIIFRMRNHFEPRFKNDEQEIVYNVSRISDQSVQESFGNMRPTEEPLVELLKGMLRVDPEERFSSEQSLREFQSIFI